MKLFEIFKRKKETETPPYKFGRIRINEVARSKGLSDDFCKEIIIYEGGKEIKRLPYTSAHVNALKNVDGMPIDEFEEKNEDFEFDSFSSFGVATYKK